MAIDPNAPPAPATESPIENEIAAYRAISPLAVASLILGLLAGLSFADTTFLIAAALAVVVGGYAEWKINRMPDVLTGHGFARAGITLGLIFGLSSVTISGVGEYVVRQDASKFAKELTEVMKTRDLPNVVFLKVPYSQRKGMTPVEAYEQMKKSGSQPEMIASYMSGVMAIFDRLRVPDTHLEFKGIEAIGYDRLTPVAGALLEIHGPETKDQPAEQYALVELKAEVNGPKRHWYMNEVYFPYKPRSFQVKSSPTGEGHGHAH